MNGAIAQSAVTVATVARMECNAIRECCCLIPDSALLHPGYLLINTGQQIARWPVITTLFVDNMDIAVIAQYGISATALLISISSFIFAIKSWHQSNRPIVVAHIEEHSMGINSATFNLVLSNTGNRPAVKIKLNASKDDIEKIFEEKIDDVTKEGIFNCFKEESEVALLKNNTSIVTSFGSFEGNYQNRKGIKYDSWLPIEITYKDLRAKKYKEKVPLKVRGLKGFGGGIWSKPKKIS